MDTPEDLQAVMYSRMSQKSFLAEGPDEPD